MSFESPPGDRAAAIPGRVLRHVLLFVLGVMVIGCASAPPQEGPRTIVRDMIEVHGQLFRALSIEIDSFPANALFEVNGRPIGRAPTVITVAAYPNETFVEPIFIRARVGETDRPLHAQPDRSQPGPESVFCGRILRSW